MPVRVSKSWRPALRAIARIQLRSDKSWDFMWATYTRNQRKFVREIQRAEDKRRWDLLRRATKPITEEKVYEYIAQRYPQRSSPDSK